MLLQHNQLCYSPPNSEAALLYIYSSTGGRGRARQTRARWSVGGVWRAGSKREGRCVQAVQCVSPLELDFALLTSCTFPPVTKSKYIHTLKCTVIRSDLGASRLRGVGQLCRLLRTQPTHKIEISEHDFAGKIPVYHSYTFLSFNDTT